MAASSKTFKIFFLLTILLLTFSPAESQQFFFAKAPGDTSAPTSIPTDSLKIAFEFETDRGVGKNTFGTSMLNLVNNADTLTLYNTPTDSTAFGYINFNSSATEYAEISSRAYGSAYTIIMKIKVYQINATNNVFIYSATWKSNFSATAQNYFFSAFTGGDVTWSTGDGRGTEYVVVWTSTGDVYRNNTLIIDGSYTLSGELPAAVLKLMSETDGYLKCFYYYNRALTPEEIALFN